MDSASGLRFALDPASAPPSLLLSNSSLTVTYRGGDPPSPPPRNDGGGTVSPDPGLTLPEACADVTIGGGQYYWEVDVCNSSVYRIGKKPPRFPRAGPMPAPSLFAETYIISQQGCACLRRQSHVNMHVLAHGRRGHRPKGRPVGRVAACFNAEELIIYTIRTRQLKQEQQLCRLCSTFKH